MTKREGRLFTYYLKDKLKPGLSSCYNQILQQKVIICMNIETCLLATTIAVVYWAQPFLPYKTVSLFNHLSNSKFCLLPRGCSLLDSFIY